MKREGYLLDQISEYGNLAKAFHKAAQGKRQQSAVMRFEAKLSANLSGLGTSLRDGRVSVGRFHQFTVRDPKVRVIHAASFPERVLHHAIMNVAGAFFERGADDHSYACREGKGNGGALKYALRATTGRRYFLQMDVRKYFDSVDQSVLKRLFRRSFKEEAFLHLLDRIVDSYATAPGRGLPIGSLTSQYFANFYLDGLDRFVRETLRGRRYVRFMDDLVLWDDDPRFLSTCQGEIEEWLRRERGLLLKESTRLAASTQGVDFLGYRLKPGRVLLSRRSRQRFRRRLRDLEADYEDERIGEEELQRRSSALVAFTERADCRRWRARVVRRSSLSLSEGRIT
ncbi:MAG: RNA-directed DNA polymerase [Verrucomicrobiota bacterium]